MFLLVLLLSLLLLLLLLLLLVVLMLLLFFCLVGFLHVFSCIVPGPISIEMTTVFSSFCSLCFSFSMSM